MSKATKKREWTAEDMLHAMDEKFDEFKNSYIAPYMPRRTQKWERGVKMPRMDMDDHGDHYEVNVEVPGVSKEAVQVHVTKKTLEIEADIEEEKRKDRKNMLVSERSHNEIYRRITFPEEIDPEEVEATSSNGLLKITAPKKYKPEDKKKIEVKSA